MNAMSALGVNINAASLLIKDAVASTEEMKGAVYLQPGDEKVIQISDHVSRPVPNDNQLLIKVNASGVNPVDLKLRENTMPTILRPLPKIIGSDMSGVVVAKGKATSEKFKVGDKVFAMMPHVFSGWGSACEYAAVDEDHLALIPSGINAVEAASLPLISLTVIQSMKPFVDYHKGNTAGRSVLVQAGGGGLGTFAIQYCKNVLGMKVYTTCSAANAEFVKSMGADVAIDYKTQKFEEEAVGMDLVFDPMAYQYETRTLNSQVLKKDSFYINIPSSSKTLETNYMDPLRLAIPEAAPHRVAVGYGSVVTRRVLHWLGLPVCQYVYHFVKPDGAVLEQVARMITEGKVKPVVEKENIFPLEEMAAAHIRLKEGSVRGKVVVRVAEEE